MNEEILEHEVINISKRKLQTIVLHRASQNLSRYVKNQRVLCLPGQSGWDLDYFRVNKHVVEIVGLEEDKEIYGKLCKRYKNVGKIDLQNLKTSEFLVSTDKKFDIIYLDYFSNLNTTVRFDIETILERQALNKWGKCIVNFYGARETITDQYVNEKLYKDACLFFNQPMKHLGNPEMLRCAAFNALVIQCRRKYKLRCSSVAWKKYLTQNNNAHMYTGWFSINSYGSRSDSSAVRVSPDNWFLTGEYGSIPLVRAKNFAGVMGALARRGLTGQARKHWMAKIQKFYNEHHYTPHPKEIGTTKLAHSGGKWAGYIRELGLCPRIKATEKELIEEIRRIELRDGQVTYEGLQRAMISRRLGWSAEFRRLCEKHKIKYHLQAEASQKEQLRLLCIDNIRKYLAHIDSGRPRTNSSHYSFMQKRGIIEYGAAASYLYKLTNPKEQK